jgi:hypothetical protein
MAETLKVPRLKVRRNWFVGLNPDPVNRSPDVDKADAALEKELKVGGCGLLGHAAGSVPAKMPAARLRAQRSC